MQSLQPCVFVLSGAFSVSRQELEGKIRSRGGRVENHFTQKVNILCIGNDPKPFKIEEARLREIKIVNEDFVWAALRPGLKRLPTPDRFGVEEVQNPQKRQSKRKVDPDFVDEILTKKQKNLSKVPKILYKKVIALEGNIGVGKSTLSKLLRNTHPEHCSIYEEQTNQSFLKLFYNNPAKYGFAFQWGMLKTRIYQLHLAQHDADTSRMPQDRFFVWDRSMIGDYIFAFWNHLQGSISKEEMLVYESEFGGSMKSLETVPFFKDIHCFTFLNDEPSACKYRVEQHRKNESEQGIPLPYYEGIDDMHFSMMLELLKKKVAKVMVLNWGEYDCSEEVIRSVTRVINGKQKVASVTHSAAPKKASNRLIYKTPQDILNTYQLIKTSNVEELKSLLAGVESVYIPEDIMKIDPVDKNVVLEHLKPYGVKFYQNEYKRVVFYHVSKFHDVHFYKSH